MNYDFFAFSRKLIAHCWWADNSCITP